MFEPRLALASLSGESDAAWAAEGPPFAGAAFLGGIALCPDTRDAARDLVARGRTEFLPSDPISFVDEQCDRLHAVDLRPAINVRSTEEAQIARTARVCADHGAILEVNAHCRQAEMCDVGSGETLLRDPERLACYVRTAAATGVQVSVKVRAEVDGVDLAVLARRLERAGADAIHVDAMDTRSVIRDVAGTDLFVIANNGVRGPDDVREYLEYGADAVSVGRASDDQRILERVSAAVTDAVSPRHHSGESPAVANDK